MRKTQRLHSPIKWFGGKGSMTAKLLPLLPPHGKYVEVFGGGASLLFAKPPALEEVYNDLDAGAANFFRVLKDPSGFERLYALASLTPYSREEYDICRRMWESCTDDAERAYRWFVVARMSFSGRFGCGWSSVISSSARGMASSASSWTGALRALPLAHERLQNVAVEQMDFRRLLSLYDSPETLFYLDPPYVPDTRRAGEYRHELCEKDHGELVQMLLSMKGRAMLSGYAHPVYRPLELSGWGRIDFPVACQAVGRTRASGLVGEGRVKSMQPRVESLWISPER
jgi:DNA adenine methylase